MSYGHFDEKNREYVITDQRTPAPWANYLGSPEYGAIITNSAGGYSFVKSGAKGRILKYHFNFDDTPGRYVYIRDDDSGAVHTASWFPAKGPGKYTVRHGTGYSVFDGEENGVESSVLYYVPKGADYEVWAVRVTNKSGKTRSLSVTGYAEFTAFSDYHQDQINLQYTQFVTRTNFDKNRIVQEVNGNCAPTGSNQPSRFFALAGAEVSSYCGDREAFIGHWRDYGSPEALDGGKLPNKLNYNANACGALQTALTLKDGESREFVFVLGQGGGGKADTVSGKYGRDLNIVGAEVGELVTYWHSKLGNLKINTPDEDFNVMINTWNAYQCFITFTWSRAASLIYCGDRNGYGYRDTVQDIQGIIHLDPALAAEKIEFMLSAQVHHGGALPLVKFDHNAGHEDSPEDESYASGTGHPSYRADDALWLFPTVWKYVAETGDAAFLDKVIPYATHGEDAVYDHLLKAVEFSLNHLGIHGLPAGLHADWNDCLRLGKNGASVFVALQLYYAFEILRRFAEYRKDDEQVRIQNENKARFGAIIDKLCFDGDRFVRGFTEGGEVIGCKNSKEAAFWLNPQSWAVISGFAETDRAKTILDATEKHLNTEYGLRLMDTPFTNHPFEGALALLFNPSTKENAGIFLQSQGWIILAEALSGNGERAFKYYKESCPAAQNGIADTRRLEPYVYGQFTESVLSPYEGRSHVHWLTGTASTVMVGAVEGILGLRPDIDGITISPSVPASWKDFTMTKQFRGKTLNISVKNAGGAKKLTLNGETLGGLYVPAGKLKDTNEIEVSL